MCLEVSNLIGERWTGGSVSARFQGLDIHVHPEQYIDRNVLFMPQWYDHNELRLLRDLLAPGDTFVDVGANIGVWSLVASQAVGPSGHVTAIEANSEVAAILKSNARVNGAMWMQVVEAGVSDREETLILNVQTRGNIGASTFLEKHVPGVFDEVVHVTCYPLTQLVTHPVKVLKLDCEGFEYRIMRQFLQDCSALPQFVITERNEELFGEGDVVDLLESYGYEVFARYGNNFFLRMQFRLGG